MHQIDLLLVGDAKDGPTGELVRVKSLDRAARLFGAWAYHTTAITSGATGTNLTVTPWGGSVEPLRSDSDGLLIPTSLHEFTASGSTLTWTALGTAQTVYFRVLETPGDTSLLAALFALGPLLNDELQVYALRLGGDHATAGPSGGFLWTARYPGSRYNGATIVVSGGRVTVAPTVGAGRQRIYHPTSDAQLRTLLADDLARGYQPYWLSGQGSERSFTVPSGTYTFAGGADGTLTASGVTEFVRDYDLDGVDVVCPVGLSTAAVSGAGALALLAENRYPTLLVAQAATTGPALSGSVNTSRHLVSVGFQATLDGGTTRARTADAAPYVAGLLAARRFGTTWAPLGLETNPRYDQLALHAVTDAGHTLPTLSISKGPALYRAVTGDALWTVATFRVFQSLARAVYTNLEPLLGATLVNLQPVRAALGAAFSELPYGTVTAWLLTLEHDVLYLEVDFRVPGEVQAIKARLSLGGAAPPE